jgi:hypothetical protein
MAADQMTVRGRRGRDHMVVWFTTTYAINAYHHYSCESRKISILHPIEKYYVWIAYRWRKMVLAIIFCFNVDYWYLELCLSVDLHVLTWRSHLSINPLNWTKDMSRFNMYNISSVQTSVHMVVYGSVHILPYDPQCHELFAICCLLFDAICYFYVLTV